jgi:hypothetical protein
MGLNAVPYLLYHRRGESDGLPSAGHLVLGRDDREAPETAGATPDAEPF